MPFHPEAARNVGHRRLRRLMCVACLKRDLGDEIFREALSRGQVGRVGRVRRVRLTRVRVHATVLRVVDELEHVIDAEVVRDQVGQVFAVALEPVIASQLDALWSLVEHEIRFFLCERGE